MDTKTTNTHLKAFLTYNKEKNSLIIIHVFFPLPQLPGMFPGLLMILQVYASQVPLFSFKPGSVLLDLQSSVKAFAIQPNGTQTPLFKLNMVSTCVL